MLYAQDVICGGRESLLLRNDIDLIVCFWLRKFSLFTVFPLEIQQIIIHFATVCFFSVDCFVFLVSPFWTCGIKGERSEP